MGNKTSRWAIYEEAIKEIIIETNLESDTEIARQVCHKLNITLSFNELREFRKYVYRHKKRILDDYEGSYEATDSLDIDNTTVKHMWVKSKNASLFVKNPNFIKPEDGKADFKEIDFLSIFKDKIEPIILDIIPISADGFDRFIYTDVHVGMCVDKDGFALYEGKWDEEQLNIRLAIAINWILEHKKFDTLYISDLGDFMDGWDGMTIRREHHLPQNMDNQKAFDTALRFKIKMIDSLIPYFNKIVCNNITDDNHSGAFSYIVNSAFKTYIELKYPNKVTVNIQRKFMDYYFVMDKYCIIECHGKDGGTMKFGMKPQINDKIIKTISHFIDENFLYKKGMIIEFNKGDSHQSLIDKSCSTKFQYHNFPSFAPPSNWVKTNFQNSMSGFSFRNYYINGQISNHDYIF
mgnify:CR=1 FL=1